MIYDENMIEIAREDISAFSSQKGSESGIPDETGNKPDELSREDSISPANFSEKIVKYWWILLIVLAALLIALFYSFRKGRTEITTG